ncbi:MAG: M28 family peptidase [Bacteroidetes bacterium]|nr:M28 family peptidase [Bacteroidota bacterium]
MFAKQILPLALSLALVQPAMAQTLSGQNAAITQPVDRNQEPLLPRSGADQPAPVDPLVSAAATITDQELQEHLYLFASEEMQGRGTGLEGQRRAANYLETEFKAMGLKPVGNLPGYRQPFDLKEESWGDVYVESGGQRYAFLKDFYAYPGMNNPVDLQADGFVFLGYGIDDSLYSDYAGMDVQGKVLVIMAGEPQNKEGNYWLTGTNQRSDWSMNWRKKLGVATEKGARALLVISTLAEGQLQQKNFVNYLNNPDMQLASETEGSPYVNSLYLTVATGKGLFGKQVKVMDKGLKKINEKFEPASREIRNALAIKVQKQINSVTSDNVLGMVPGTDRADEYIVVTAHYDHLGFDSTGIYYGADDDGSGTVALLEIAEAVQYAAAQGLKPRRNIIFMAVSGEEKGLLGSEFYTDNPAVPLEQTVTNLNIDMVGRIDKEHEENPFYVYIIGSDFLSTELHALSETAATTYPSVSLDYKYNNTTDPNRYYYRSDHYNFAKNNIPIIFYMNGNHNDYHQITDTPDKIRYDVLQARARLIFHTLWLVSQADKRPIVDGETN